MRLLAHWRRYGAWYSTAGAVATMALAVWTWNGGAMVVALIWALAAAVSLPHDDDPAELTDDECDRLLAELRDVEYRPDDFRHD